LILKRMTATFGCLENATLTLADGFNLIATPNESGKSTWSAFLIAMLYGIPTREKDRQGVLAEKNRYQPWSGAPLSGRIECVWRGRELILERSTPKPNLPMKELTARWGDTGETVRELTAETAGETLTGVGREVFERSAFVRQAAVGVDGSGELERRIAALVSSGEEDVSFPEVDERLKKQQNRRRHNKTGLIPALEEEFRQTNGTLGTLGAIHADIEAQETELDALTARRDALGAELRGHDAWEARARYQKIDEARGALAQAVRNEERARADLTVQNMKTDAEAVAALRTELSALSARARRAREAEDAAARLDAAAAAAEAERDEKAPAPFRGLSGAEAWRKAEEASAVCREAARKMGRRPARFSILLPLALCVLAAAVYVSLRQTALPSWASVLPPAALAAFAAAGLLLRGRSRKANAAAYDSALGPYGVDRPETLMNLAAAYREAAALADARRGEAEEARRLAGTLRAEVGGQAAPLLARIRASAPEARDFEGADAALSERLERCARHRAAFDRLEQARNLFLSLAAMGEVPEGAAAATEPARPREEVEADLEATESRRRTLTASLAARRGEQRALGDVASLTAQREAAESRLETLSAEYDAIALAREALEEANDTLRSRFAPALSKRAGEIFALLTGGRYDALTLDRTFAAAARRGEDTVSRSALWLSRGATDELYLAVRLAICELALPREDPVPLVLDDALVNFDGARMARALEYLLAQPRQTLLFTCHDRERAYLEGREGVRAITAW